MDEDLAELLRPIAQSSPSTRASLPEPSALFSQTGGEGDDLTGAEVDTVLSDSKSSIIDSLQGETDNEPLHSVFAFRTESQIRSICAGFVRNSTVTFCRRPCIQGQNHCASTAHSKRKHTMHPNTIYIAKNTTSAYCQPTLEVVDLDSERVTKLLEVSHTVDRWRELFSAMNQGKPYGSNQDNDDKVVKEISMVRTKMPLATPAKIEAKPKRETTVLGSLEESVEIDLPEEIHIKINESLEEEWRSLPDSVTQVLKDMAKAISELSARLIGISRDMTGTDSMWNLIGNDLENLDASLRQTRGLIGEPVKVNGIVPPNVWTGIDAASGSNSLYNEKLSKTIHELQQKVNSVSNVVETFK